MPIKQIMKEKPHFRYKMDLWYLDQELKQNINYNYCFDIIDNFNKFLQTYLI